MKDYINIDKKIYNELKDFCKLNRLIVKNYNKKIFTDFLLSNKNIKITFTTDKKLYQSIEVDSKIKSQLKKYADEKCITLKDLCSQIILDSIE